MTKILTLTLNPSIDKSTNIDALIPELKLRCSTPKYEPGGGGINVSRALSKLGTTSKALYFSGGHTGEIFDELIALENIEYQRIAIKGNTRENMIVLETSSNKQYRFGMDGPTIETQEWQNLLDEIAKMQGLEFLVGSGSLAPGLPIDFYARLAKIATKINAKFILDTSGEPLQAAAKEGVYLLKPNIGELANMCGLEELRTEQIKEKALEIIVKGNCKMVVVSLGPQGAILVTKDEYIKIPAPTVKKRSTVGAGDSMVAGMVHQLSKAKSVKEIGMFGVACGSAATMNYGTELCKKEDVETLYAWIEKQV